MSERTPSGSPYRVPAENTETQEEKERRARAELHRKADELGAFLNDPMKRPLPSEILRRLADLKEEGFGFTVDFGYPPVLFCLSNSSLQEPIRLKTAVGGEAYNNALHNLGFSDHDDPLVSMSEIKRAILNYQTKVELSPAKGIRSKEAAGRIIKDLEILRGRLASAETQISKKWDDVRVLVATHALLEVLKAGEHELVEESRERARRATAGYKEFSDRLFGDIENDLKLLKEV